MIVFGRVAKNCVCRWGRSPSLGSTRQTHIVYIDVEFLESIGWAPRRAAANALARDFAASRQQSESIARGHMTCLDLVYRIEMGDERGTGLSASPPRLNIELRELGSTFAIRHEQLTCFPIVDETPQSREPMHGRGASWSPSHRFEKLHVDVNNMDVVDVDPKRRGATPTADTIFYATRPNTIIARNQSPDVGSSKHQSHIGVASMDASLFARPSMSTWVSSAGLDFESRIVVSTTRHDCSKPNSSSKWKPQLLMMSGVTDCYQPIERKCS